MKTAVTTAIRRIKSDPKQQKRIQEIVITVIALSFFYLDPSDRQLFLTFGLILFLDIMVKLARRIIRRKQQTTSESSPGA